MSSYNADDRNDPQLLHLFESLNLDPTFASIAAQATNCLVDKIHYTDANGVGHVITDWRTLPEEEVRQIKVDLSLWRQNYRQFLSVPVKRIAGLVVR